MIVPNYNSYKQGLCTDLEYFKFSYAGKDGQVIKRYLPHSFFPKKVTAVLKGKNVHPFYAIKRPLEPLHGCTRYEFKIYDFYHNGYIEREEIVESKEEGIEIPTLTTWYNNKVAHGSHFRDYLYFCVDSLKY